MNIVILIIGIIKTYIANNTRFTIHILLFYMILKMHISNIAY